MDNLKLISAVFNSFERGLGGYSVTKHKYNILCKYMNRSNEIQNINIMIGSDCILPKVHINRDFVRNSIRNRELIFINIRVTSEMHNGVHSIGVVWFPISNIFKVMETNRDIDYHELWGARKNDINKIIAAELFKVLCTFKKNPKIPVGHYVGVSGMCINITANNLDICICHANTLLIFSMIKSKYVSSPTSAFDRLSQLDCKQRSFTITYFIREVALLVDNDKTYCKNNMSYSDKDLDLYSCGIPYIHNYNIHEYYAGMSESEKEEHEKIIKENDYYRRYCLKSEKNNNILGLSSMFGHNEDEQEI